MFDPITLSTVICAKIGWLWIEGGYSLCEEIWDHKSHNNNPSHLPNRSNLQQNGSFIWCVVKMEMYLKRKYFFGKCVIENLHSLGKILLKKSPRFYTNMTCTISNKTYKVPKTSQFCAIGIQSTPIPSSTDISKKNIGINIQNQGNWNHFVKNYHKKPSPSCKKQKGYTTYTIQVKISLIKNPIIWNPTLIIIAK